MQDLNRRNFLKSTASVGAALAAMGAEGAFTKAASQNPGTKKFKISLAAWSLNRDFKKTWVNLDLPRIVREEFDLDGLEFVNTFFDLPLYGYLKELKKRAEDYGVKLVLIMCDDEGDMSHIEKSERMQAVINHRKWVDIAHFLGCHAIRGNARTNTPGTDDERVARAAESYRALCEYADQAGISVTVENHGGFSSLPDKLISLVKQVNHPRFGLLPDFGNFAREVDRYEALKSLMPYAKAMSVKCLDFLPDGSHPAYDLDRMVEIVLAAGYNGYMGIEYSGKPAPHEGVLACKALLQRHQ
ncbi:MAG TPA: TIM barrel protein [archaeon]|nr:TIM barrel protein [archaeon]